MTKPCAVALLIALGMALPMPAWAQAVPAAPASPAADPVVARVDGVELHRSDVLQYQHGLPEQARQLPIEQIYPVMLDQMVSGLLLAEAGRKAKLADDPEVKKRTAQLQDQVIEEVYLTRIVDAALTDQRLHARYQQFIKDAPPKEEVRASHILVAKEDDAKAIIADLKKGADFATLAKQKSTDPAGKSGGDLGYFGHDDMVPEFADAAFKLKPGEFTQTPVKTQFGWHVILVVDRRQAAPPSFEEARDQLSEDLSREIVKDKIKELRSGAKVETFTLEGAPMVPAAPAPPGPTLLKP
jgi:peptidyl-prolyl cis-trans isomerase C